jgi:hypothetical protein
MAAEAHAAPTLICKPLTPNAKSDEAAWPGEGQYLWNNGGIADTHYITGPTYLLNAGMRTVGRVDNVRIRRRRSRSLTWRWG